MRRCRHTPTDITASGPYRHILGLHRGWRPPLKGQHDQRGHVLKGGAIAGLHSAAHAVKPHICRTLFLFAVADAGKASPFHNEKVSNATNTMPVSGPQTPQIREPQTQFSHQHCSRGSANKGNSCPALIWFIHMPLLYSSLLLSLFSEERNRPTKVSKVIKENCEVAGTGSQKQYPVSHVLLSVFVFLQPDFSLLFFSHLAPATSCQIVLHLQKTWIIDLLSDFNTERNYCEPLICISGNQSDSGSSSCKQVPGFGRDTTFKMRTSISLCVFCSSLFIKLFIPFLDQIY